MWFRQATPLIPEPAHSPVTRKDFSLFLGKKKKKKPYAISQRVEDRRVGRRNNVPKFEQFLAPSCHAPYNQLGEGA
jgi:hypothetical protein